MDDWSTAAGIAFLTVASALLLIGFKGMTDRLIPLYAVGAFMAFTLSQAGMVAHWWKRVGETDDSKHKPTPTTCQNYRQHDN